VLLARDAARRALAAAHDESAHFISAFPRKITRTLGEAMIVPLIPLFYLRICDGLDAAPADAERFGRLRLVHARAPRPRISPPTATARCEQPSTTG
jgi:hypothetical protein